MEKTAVAVLAILTGVMLSGCAWGKGSTFPPEQNVIYVSKDGGLYTAIVEHYDPSDTGYSADELKDMAFKEAADYNKEYGGGQERVSVAECTIEEGRATLVHKYAAAEDLCSFTQITQDTSNHTEHLQITTNSVYLTGNDSDGGWTDARKNSSTTLGTVRKKKDLPLIVITGPATVQTEGRILYYSGAVSLADEFTAQVSEGEGYIVFK